MIFGTGIDIVSLQQFDKLVRDEESVFLKRHFTAGELLYSERVTGEALSHLAGAYAAKEAMIKALDATHLFRPRRIPSVDYREIEVAHDPEGRPYLLLTGSIGGLMDEMAATSHLSISHDGEYAVAQVILSRNNR